MRTLGTVALAVMVSAGASSQDANDVAVAGRAVFKGDIKRVPKEPLNEECARCHPDGLREADELVHKENRGIQNVFVWVKGGLAGKKFAVPEKAVEIVQEKCVYIPRVTGAMEGQEIGIKNGDTFAHNVHMLPKQSKEQNFVQLPGQRDVVRLNAEVMVFIKCDVHGHMKAWVGVVSHPFFKVTDADGAWTLPALPAGEYTIAAWHEVYGAREQRVKVEKGMKAVEFEFEKSP